ncbi:hypothetical protein [Treponema sp. C6A8]|uniref:hypothetical protein n=1 Tax=Treponema sp. C6A8 TaxID=1410609 RepID=UPI000483A720|nr:hypothetical protein [Treponema sp. C6A8]
MKINEAKLKTLLRAIVIAGLFIFVFLVRFSMLQKSSEANGLDGYFYALQAKSFAENGHLENPSYEPGYYLCGICSFFTGDAVTGVKLWSALSSAGISAAVFLLIYLLTGNTIFSFLGFFLSAASPTITLFGINYINNQTGILFLLLYACALAASNKSASIIFFLLSCISHKVSMLLALLLTFFLIIYKGILIIREKKSDFKIKNPAVKITLICSALLFFAAAGFFLVSFLALHSPRFLHAFDFPHLPLFNKNFLNNVDWGAIEMTLYAPLIYFLALLAIIKKVPGRKAVLLVPFIYFPLWNLDSDMGLRMWMNAVPLGIPLLIYFVFIIDNFNISKKQSTGQTKKRGKSSSLVYILWGIYFIGFMYLIPETKRLYNPKNDPPYQYYKKIVQKLSDLPQDSLLIAHLGLNHVYTYENNLKDGLNWLPDFEIAPEKTWRLAYGANEGRIREVLNENSSEDIRTIDQNYLLIREDLWQQYLENEDEQIAETFYNWYNPHEVRPQYIRRSK